MARPVSLTVACLSPCCSMLIAVHVLGFKGLFSSSYVALCAAFSAMGGLLFGYEYVANIPAK